MNKIKRIFRAAFSILLVISILGTNCVFARNNYVNGETKPKMLPVEYVDTIDGIVFYYYESADTRKCVTYEISSEFLNYAELKVADNIIIEGTMNKASSQIVGEDFKAFFESIGAEQLSSMKINKADDFGKRINVAKSVSESERAKIESELYKNNPHPYTNNNTRVVNVSGTSVILKDDLSYSISSHSIFWIVAGTTLSAMSVILGIPGPLIFTLIGAAGFTVGLYELKNSAHFYTYDVYGNWIKKGYVNNTQYSDSWLRKEWTAVTSSSGEGSAALYLNRTVSDSIYSNDNQIAQIAYNNYQIGYSPY